MNDGFIGRHHELDQIGVLLESRTNSAPVVLIAGEPGVGKTRLMREVSRRAESLGWEVLQGRAYDSEGMPPYLPFAEAIAQHERVVDTDAAGTSLATAAPEIALLVPELRGHVTSSPRRSSASPGSDRYRLFDAVAEYFLAIAAANSQGLLLRPVRSNENSKRST
jgi:hypothetical protein